MGCASGPGPRPPLAGVVPTPAPSRAPLVLIPEYRLGFGDVIEVKFFDQDRFNETVAVRPDGRITLQRVGDVFVAGMTPTTLDSLITATYTQVLRAPDVSVFVRQFSKYQVYLLGEVRTPGGYPLQPGMTLVQSLALAGGVTKTARLGEVVVLRQGAAGGANGFKVDLGPHLDPGRSAAMDSLVYLQPQDIVYVPKTALGTLNDFLTQVWSGLTPPLDTYLRWLWLERQTDQ